MSIQLWNPSQTGSFKPRPSQNLIFPFAVQSVTLFLGRNFTQFWPGGKLYFVHVLDCISTLRDEKRVNFPAGENMSNSRTETNLCHFIAVCTKIMILTDIGLPARALRRPCRRHNENIIAVQGSDDGNADGGAAGGARGHDDDADNAAAALFIINRQRQRR